MTRILKVLSLVFAFVFAVNGIASAAVHSPAPSPIKYTADQQSCINSAQLPALKAAQDALTAATPEASKIRQEALKAAQDALTAATPEASKIRQEAVSSAQKITDLQARKNAIKNAYDAYNNDPTVVREKVAYMAALKAAGDAYNRDPAVKVAMVPYVSAMKSARDAAVKKCTENPLIGSAPASLFQAIGNLFKGSISALINAFTFTK